MRTWRLLFAVGLLAALLVPASGASAEPHETGTTAHTLCDVNGTVTLSGHPNGGLDSNRSDGHYEFDQTSLECRGQFNGTWNVSAEGDTTDLWHGNPEKDGLGSGEDCEQGGSAKATDGDLHSGTLNATGTPDLEGNVHFARLGTVVLADGPLTDGTEEHFFQGEFQFTPTEGDCTDKNNPVTEASLVGEAQIYDTTDPAYFHDCTLEGDEKHTNDPHCTL